MITAGVDIGSTASKALLMSEGRMLSSIIGPSSTNPARTARDIYDQALAAAGVTAAEVRFVVGTGYGRAQVPFAHTNVSEISCHGRGAHFALPSARTVIDIGGQDTKAISIDRSGNLLDFAMNDKCAAGTGRFFEVMARALEIDLDDLGPRALEAKKSLGLSSVCTVFAESEVVGMVARGETVEDIAAALCAVSAEKVVALAHRVGVESPVTVTGGVPKNIGFLRALEKQLGLKVNVPEEPQIMGALGAALISIEELCASRKVG